MNMLNIKKWLERSLEFDNSLGCEIKYRRKIKNQTLASLSDEICSISYMSKVENHKIFPNKEVLQQVCYKLDMSNDDIDGLYQLNDYLIESISCFYMKNNNKLLEIYENVKCLTNFRAELIKIMYLISIKNYNLVNKILNKIEGLFGKFNHLDMLVYSIFYAIFLNKTLVFLESIETLNLILPYLGNEKYLKRLANYYLCDAYFNLGNYKFIILLKKCLQDEFTYGTLENAEQLKKMQFLFYYKKGDQIEINNSLALLENSKNYIDLLGIVELENNNLNFFTKSVLNKVEEFTKLLYYFKRDKKKFKESVEKIQMDEYDIRVYIYLNYLNRLEVEEEELLEYLEETAFAHSVMVMDSYYATIYGQKIISIYQNNSKYKKALEYSIKLNDLYVKLETI